MRLPPWMSGEEASCRIDAVRGELESTAGKRGDPIPRRASLTALIRG